MKRKLCAAIGALSFVLLTWAPAVLADDPRYEIRLLAERFTPQPRVTEAAQQQLMTRAEALRRAGQETVHVLVQLHKIPSFAEREGLRGKGLDLGPYVPGHAWIAALPVDEVEHVTQLSEVRWLELWDAESKLHPRVKAKDWGPWTRDPSRPGWVMTMLQLHHDVPIERAFRLADAVGGAAMEPLAGVHGLTVWVQEDRIAELARFEDVLWIEEGPMPLSPNNDGARAFMRADAVIAAPFNLDGTGVDLFVFDAGTVRATHNTFNAGAGSRVTVIDGQGAADHPTHVAGTAAGDGSGSSGGRGRGVATGADIFSAGYEQSGGTMLFWDNAGDIQADYGTARNTHGADIGTNSIGSNTASNGYPCSREGDYGTSSNMVDGIVRGDNGAVSGAMIMTWANGNERTGGSPRGRCGSNYVTTAPPSCAKNPIHVGAINSDGGSMTSFSSWGPCDDGRLKPVVSAPGCESGRVTGEGFILSSLNSSDSAYGGTGWCGTSMATPATAGVVSLFIEDWRAQGHGAANDRPLPALVKAMLIQTARDQGQDGPDFIYGYGAVDAENLIALLRDGNGNLGTGTANWGTDTISNGATDTFTISVPADTGALKVSLAWDDAAAAAFAANALVNDLTLEVVAPNSAISRPFVLSAANPHLAATTGINSLDNQEQVVVTNPQAGTWTIRVVGTSVPSGPQSYGLAYRATPQAHDGTGCTTTSWGWEASNEGWTLTGGAARVAAPAGGHGSTSVRVGGTNNTTDEATLDVAVPADAVEAEFTYFWHMTTDEGSSGHGFDNFFGEIRNTSGGVLETLDLRNDGWAQGQWMEQRNIDLVPYAGQTIRLAFRATNDSSLATRFYVDDAAVTACSATGGGNTAPTVTITAPANGASFTAGDAVTFSGTATDTEDGNIAANLSWTSSLDGAIGNGASFSTSGLSVGSHTIAASVTDSGGLSDSDQISITVNPAGGGCTDCIDWNSTATVSYSNQDSSANVSVQDGGDTLFLQDNTWRRTTQTFNVTANTVVEVEFQSTQEGEIHGIGFDEDDTLTNATRIFQVHGTQTWGSAFQDFNNYVAGSGFVTYQIPVGQFYTGSAMFLVLVNDNDAGSGNNSSFRNVRVFESGPVNTAPTVTITAPANGASFTAGDSVSFSGTATDAEDGNIAANLSWTSSLDGAIGNGASFSTSGLSVGSHTITASVTDSGGLSDSDQISITINPAGGGCTDCIDWNSTATVSYSNQDSSANVSVQDGGDTLFLQDNTWRRTTQTFNVTANTVIEVEFQSTQEGEIHGIGFDENDTLTDATRIFQLHGTQNWGGAFHDFDNYVAGSGFVTYQIPVGQFYTGSAMFLVLVNDNDAGSGNNSSFRNVRVFEDTPDPGTCAADVDFSGGAAGWTNNGASTCSTGSFVIGTPTEVVNGGVTTQLAGDHTTGTGNAFFSAVNTSAGVNDVDGGNCIVTSPVYAVTEASNVSVWYYHGQRDAGGDPSGDFFLLEISTNGGSTWSTLASFGDVTVNAAWTEATTTVSAGDNVQFRIQVSDGSGSGDLVEAGIDDVSICP